jgi:predicted nucleic acid-binding protein
MIVVSDNSPLQYLVLIDCIESLPALYGEVLTTPQVIDELRHTKTPAKVRAWLDSIPAWLKIESPAKIEPIEALHIGETSALALARERKADLVLIDERAGTAVARALGIGVIGTLGILIEAGIEGLIDFDFSLGRLNNETPFYASKGLIEAARRILRRKQQEQTE